MPDNQKAREGLKQAQGLTTPQVQALAGYFEDADGFRRSFLYSSYRLYLHPRLRLYGGYGYLTYTSFENSFASDIINYEYYPLLNLANEA